MEHKYPYKQHNKRLKHLGLKFDRNPMFVWKRYKFKILVTKLVKGNLKTVMK